MRKLFKERKLFKGGNYMRKYGNRAGSVEKWAYKIKYLSFRRKLTLRDSSGVKPPSIGMTLTLFFGMTSRIEMSWVVTKTLAQTSKFLMILADHTSSKTSKLFLYWFRNNLRRISLACSTVVTDVTCKEIPNKFNFSKWKKSVRPKILTSTT